MYTLNFFKLFTSFKTINQISCLYGVFYQNKRMEYSKNKLFLIMSDFLSIIILIYKNLMHQSERY